MRSVNVCVQLSDCQTMKTKLQRFQKFVEKILDSLECNLINSTYKMANDGSLQDVADGFFELTFLAEKI